MKVNRPVDEEDEEADHPAKVSDEETPHDVVRKHRPVGHTAAAFARRRRLLAVLDHEQLLLTDFSESEGR